MAPLPLRAQKGGGGDQSARKLSSTYDRCSANLPELSPPFSGQGILMRAPCKGATVRKYDIAT